MGGKTLLVCYMPNKMAERKEKNKHFLIKFHQIHGYKRISLPLLPLGTPYIKQGN